jgi:hypothetical protein
MGYPTKVQLIKRKASEQWYINFPSALAQAMEFYRGELVDWIIEDKTKLILRRRSTPTSVVKKTPADSSQKSRNSGNSVVKPFRKTESPSGRKRSH